MSSTILYAVILLACTLTFSAAQTSCKGRCGSEYYRGFMCQCDYSCLSYGECCKDFESQCTTENSCKGRCGENFKRGRLCSCDSDCMKYKQCCPDYKSHCDAEEKINGAASATAPVKTNSCNNVNDNKPKEPNEATEQDSTFSKGNNAGGFSNNGVGDPEASLIPESTSGYESSTADLLDQISTEPTHDPEALEFSTETFTVVSQTQMTLSDNEPTQADDSPSTESTDAPTSSPEPGTTLPQATTAAAYISSQPATTSVPQTEASPTANTPELETVRQAEIQPEDDIFPKAQTTQLTGASSDKPKVTTLPSTTVPYPSVASVSTGPTQDSSTVLENSQVTTLPASSIPDLTPIPEATTSNPEPDDTDNNAENFSTDSPVGVTPEGSGNLSELNVLTTHIPTATGAAQDDITDHVTPGVTTADPLNVTPDPTKSTLSEATTKPEVKPDPYKPTPAKPSSKPETKPLNTAETLTTDDPRNYQADENNDRNLCSGRPISAVTTLRNGTMVVFRGHYFWFLDQNRVPGPARGITQVWGVPSPVDTVFTRCNCQGKTYIFKGAQYWRFENDVLDPDYPKVIKTGFDGLRGHITAALSVPQFQRRRESVYFFKRGGQVQEYSYHFGTSPTCSRKPQYPIYTVRNRMARQAVSLLGSTVNIRTSWKGFPSTITAAVSIPSEREPEGYKYVVFSRSKSYNVRMDSERPVIATPAANTSPQSSDLFKCTKKV